MVNAMADTDYPVAYHYEDIKDDLRELLTCRDCWMITQLKKLKDEAQDRNVGREDLAVIIQRIIDIMEMADDIFHPEPPLD